MRRATSWVAAAGVAAVALSLGAAGSLASSSRVAAESPPRLDPQALGRYFFGSQLARAEVVLVIGGAVHDFRVDRGRVRSVTPGAIELRERDGSIVSVAVAPDAVVRINRRDSTLAALRPGLTAITVRDGDVPASIVEASRG